MTGSSLGLAAALLIAVAPAATRAEAARQSPCGPYQILAAALDSQYHEAPVARMLADQGFAIEILAAADGSSFTVLAVQANGTACLLATGTAYAPVAAAATPGSAS